MLVTSIFAFEIAENSISMVNVSIGMPIFASLPPQIRIFQIDLKVWGFPPVISAWMGGEDILEKASWGKNFV